MSMESREELNKINFKIKICSAFLAKYSPLKQDVLTVVNGILGALVGVTGGCAVFNVYSAMVVGAVGSFLANITPPLLEYWR